jgi:hypothetical protein
MARPPEPDIPLTPEQLVALQKQFENMGESALQSFYHAAHRRCQFVNRLPTARSIQELVAVWKFMRRWKRSAKGADTHRQTPTS